MGTNGDMSKIILAKAAEVKAKVSTDVLADLTDRELGLVEVAAVIDAVNATAESAAEHATAVALNVKQELAILSEKDRVALTEHRAEIMHGLAEIRDAVKQKKTTIDFASITKLGVMSGGLIGGIAAGVVYAVKALGG